MKFFHYILTASNLAIAVLLSTQTANAQESITVTINKNGKQIEENIDLPQSMTYPLDSLLSDWKARNYIDLNKDCTTSTENPYFPDSVYIDRLHRIPTVIELTYNSIVRKFIDMYCTRQRTRIAYMLGASNFYMPLFEEALDAYGLPLELKYLPIIESALNPQARSRAGAVGLWQFMLQTGKIYGLEINTMVDERKDPIKSTWAAARYLKDMYDIYKDWDLVIASYNCGPGNINKAIKRSGGKTDFWEIMNYLPRETRGYVPSFIAINYVMAYYCKHNICPMSTGIPDDTDTISISKNLHFEQIKAVCGIDENELESLNPQYKQKIIPGESGPQTLRLTSAQISSFLEKGDSVYTYNNEVLFKNRKVVDVDEEVKSSSRYSKSKNKHRSSSSSTVSGGDGNASYHKIQRGETLSTIAKKYHVSVAKIKSWNGMRDDRLTAGEKLKIYK